jgi:hypothetical protein
MKHIAQYNLFQFSVLMGFLPFFLGFQLATTYAPKSSSLGLMSYGEQSSQMPAGPCNAWLSFDERIPTTHQKMAET